ncbi:MAG: DUF294 nucleotidyltransferase-like domain-containing protein [Endozoicomonas sp.]
MEFQERFSQPPFDRLNDSQRQHLLRAASLSWYKPGDKLLHAGDAPSSLMIVQKGVVEERDVEDIQKIYAHYAEEDLFDVRGLLDGRVRHEYVCLEEALIQEIPARLFRGLCQENPEFEAGFQAKLSEKHHQLDSSSRQDMAEFMLNRIEPGHCRPARFLPGSTSLAEAARVLENEHLDALLIKVQPGTGIVTRTDLLNALAVRQLPVSSAVETVAKSPVITISVGDYLFDALLLMTSRRIERLVVTNGSETVGLLDLNRILSLASSHSHLLAMRIARADSLSELVELSPDIENQARSLFRNGVRTSFVMKLVSTLNDQLLKRLFELYFPPDLHDKVCLLALGSEGRGEQVLRTDQDNALIVVDDTQVPSQAMLEGFTQLLLDCGWPRCQGNVMVCNPHWVLDQQGWTRRAAYWMDNSSPESMMEMAMMVDARVVAGNEQLLDEFRQALDNQLGRRESFLATFVVPALQFDSRLTFFGRLKESKDHKMDIKKAGIFPVVHGVRALALEHRVKALSTVERLSALKEAGQIDLQRASMLEEAFLVLNRLRLEQQLAGTCKENELDLDALDYRRRDMLRHCLHTVKKFRQHLRQHFHIDG